MSGKTTGAISVLIGVLALFHASSARAQDPSLPEPDSGAVVCEPGIYWTTQGNCLPLGPSATLTGLARLGMTLPPSPLPASKPDPGLAALPFKYFKLDPVFVPIQTMPGPTGENAQGFMPGFVYVSYVDSSIIDNATYFMLQNGGWIIGKGSRIGEIPKFQGLAFRSAPRNSFGWPFEQIPIMSAPGYNAKGSGREIIPYKVVQIYATQIADNMEWHMIGPDQWLEGRKVARVVPNPVPPQGMAISRWIEVNLAEQVLIVYDEYKMVFATVIASGAEPFWTRPGLFQIFQKKEAENMRNNDPADFYYLDNVPWTMYFDGPRALHGAYWRTRFGFPQSHGCVNLSVGDAHWLFNWAHEGDWVYIHDPSGLTPLDPALYQGGAY